MNNSTEVRWFRIYVFIVSLFTLGISISNIVHFNRIRNGACNAVTKREADTQFWLNIFLAFLSGILFLWSFIKLFSVEKYVSQKATQIIKKKYCLPIETQEMVKIE